MGVRETDKGMTIEKQIIVYGNGRIFHRIKDQLRGCHILAVADQKAESGSANAGDQNKYPLIMPERIREYDYDYVAISTPQYFEEIKYRLISEFQVPESKILSLFLFTEAREYTNTVSVAMVYGHLIWRTGLDCGSIPVTEHWEELERKITDEKIRYAVFVSTVLLDDRKYTWLKSLGLIRRYPEAGQIIYVIERSVYGQTGILEEKDNARIYVVTHKEYSVFQDDIYTPIAVGGYQQKGFLTDQTGDNIAWMNEKINECTAMYWIWKNQDAKIVGINHYRRFFYNNEYRVPENRLDGETLRRYLQEYDMIVYEAAVPQNWDIEYEIRQSLDPAAYREGYERILTALTQYQREYVPDFQEVWKAKKCCYCNMFATKKEIYDQYCEWLFSFLIPAVEAADLNGFDAYNRRVMGFFAERMLTVWLHHNHLSTKALPVRIP